MKFLKPLFLSLGGFIIFYCCTSNKNISDSKLSHKFEKISFQFEDSGLNKLLPNLEKNTEFKKGQTFDYLTFIKERIRIAKHIRKNVDPDFSGEKVQFEIDTTLAEDKFSVLAIIKK